MSNRKGNDFPAESYKEIARRSVEAGIADETAAYEQAIEPDEADTAGTQDGEAPST